jgi:hypothetical protein
MILKQGYDGGKYFRERGKGETGLSLVEKKELRRSLARVEMADAMESSEE